jgi:hypothetical protein
VDGDGRADLVVLDGRTGGVTVHPGGPHATFGVAAPSTALGLDSALLDGRGADVFGVADVDGDGHGDLLAAADDGHAYVYRGREDGTFASPVASFAGTFDVSRRGSAGHEVLGLGDVDGDGRADLVTFYTRDGSVYVYSADGAGVFSRQRSSFRGTFQSRYAGGAGHYAVGVADVDGDGRADLTTVHSDGNAYVYPGQRDGSFGGYVASFDGSFTLSSMAARFHEPIGLGDVNGDGRADLTSAYRDGCVYTYPGGADGRFGYGVRTCRPETDAASIELVDTMDVDADGFADLVTIAAGGVVSVLRGQPSGGFDASRSGAVSISTVRIGGSDEALSEDRTVRRRGAIFDVP